MKPKFFKNRDEWREWLEENHDRQTELWLLFYKKHTGKKYLTYNEAVEEALCFGWIDSTVRRIDDEKHMQRYTPRKDKSCWAKSNKKRVKQLIAEGRMTEAGMKKIRLAKKDGSWDRFKDIEESMKIPDDLKKALSKRTKAAKHFQQFAPSYQKQYLAWLASAKTDKTRQSRLAKIVERAEANLKPGI